MAHGKTLELAKITLAEPEILKQPEVELTKDGKAINRRMRRAYGLKGKFEKPSRHKLTGTPREQRLPFRSSVPAKRNQAKAVLRKYLKNADAGQIDEINAFVASQMK
jgi:hypothetical protein